MPSSGTDQIHTIGVNLALEAGTGEVCGRLAAEGIESIVLRGPDNTAWLYGDPDIRESIDIDVMVSPGDIAGARRTLVALGYAEEIATTPGTRSEHATAWRRPHGTAIDLHWSVVGAAAGPTIVWAALRAHAQPSSRVPYCLIPDDVARGLLTVLHAAQHGSSHRRTLDDLECALDRLDAVCLDAVARLAQSIGATTAFSAGLRLSRRGAAIATRLELRDTRDAWTALRSGPDATTPTATGYAWLSETDKLSRKGALLWRKLLPPVPFMREWLPIARRGRVGLAVAYVYRPLWLAWWTPRGYLAWRRAKKIAEASQRRHD